MIELFEKSLEFSLHKLLHTQKGRNILKTLDSKQIFELGEKIARDNPFNDNHLLDVLISNIWTTGSLSKFISHCLWCAHREALCENTNGDVLCGLPIEVRNTNYIIEIQETPTIIICPMTVSTTDALNIVMEIYRKFLPDREIIIYGENMGPYLEQNPRFESIFAESNISGIKKIRQVLRNNGIFFTYADFVYDVHRIIQGKLFGIVRNYSHGLISIAVSSQAALLPLTIFHQSDHLEVNLFEPVKQNTSSYIGKMSVQQKEEVLCMVLGKILEGLILNVPNQWRLLSTLTHEIEYTMDF